MKNHIEDSIYENILKTENGKEFLDANNAISKKYIKLSKNKKNGISNNHLVNVCFESNVIDVTSDTWWLNSGAIIHACNSILATK